MSSIKLSFAKVFEDTLKNTYNVIPWDDIWAEAYSPHRDCPEVFALPLQPGEMAKSHDREIDVWWIFIGTRFGTVAVYQVHHQTGTGGCVVRDSENEVLYQLLPHRPVSAKDLTVIVGKNGNILNNIGHAIERMANTFCKEN